MADEPVLKNPYTTVIGYIVLAGAVLTLLGKLLTGNLDMTTDWPILMGALVGAGFVKAADGGH